MDTLFYSSGKAALVLGVTQEHIRDLCSTGTIAAQSSNGGQWRISKAEVERLKRDGLPPLARALPGHNAPPPAAGHGLFAKPSEQVIEAAEEVVVLENEVKGLGLRRQKEEALDWFRERQEEEAERVAAQEEIERQQREAEREERAQAEQRARRQDWFTRWQQYALRSIPAEARNQVEIELYEAISQVLVRLEPAQDRAITQRLVDAGIEQILGPWRRRREIEAVLLAARDEWLPWNMRSVCELSEHQIRAVKVAAAAIAALRDSATLEEIRAVGKAAVQKIVAEFEAEQANHRAAREDTEMREWIIKCARFPDRLSDPGKEMATQAIREALARLPSGTPRPALDRAVAETLAPYHVAVAALQAEAQAQQRRRQDQALRQGLLGSVSLPSDLPAQQKQEALAAVSEALAKVPEGASQRELEKARSEVLQPLLDAYAQRAAEERRKQADQVTRQAVSSPDGLRRNLFRFTFGNLVTNW